MQLSADEARQAKPFLTTLILNAVESGASIGFLPPLSEDDAIAYWQSVIDALETPYRMGVFKIS